MSPSVFFALVSSSVILLMAILLFIFAFYNKVYKPKIFPNRQRVKASKTPVIQSSAKLVAKTKELSYRRFDTPTSLFLVFEFPNGERKDFLVNSSTYNTILEGDEGTLTYHELGDTRVFVSFQPKR